MKTIGLIGGMSWESSDLYYRIINKKTQALLGGVHSCDCLLYSVDFAEVARLQHQGRWDLLSERMVSAAHRLELGGAEMIILCTNTMHKVAADIEGSINVPFLHIVDATAEEIQKKSYRKLGLLATKFSMEDDFLRSRYKDRFNIETIVPDDKGREDVHRIIYEELVKGTITDKSKQRFLEVIDSLVQSGAEAIIAGCTEIELLIKPGDISVDLFQTTKIHAEKAVEIALGR
ncbi:aspartate/glutamate racemase family protein [Sabulibacter ruber]|uniref:aspartate/glutamate racemase family protein n=1 Tax=Sabulibacter ruber TaxID=2811901 RepID=UPI001A978A26|nr:aspartate/glutamate racemase family protein [Sabulibacter ruber]